MSRLFLIVALVMAKSLLVGALGSVVPYRLQWPIPATAAERWSDWHVAMGRSPVKRSEFVRSSDKCSRGRRRPEEGKRPVPQKRRSATHLPVEEEMPSLSNATGWINSRVGRKIQGPRLGCHRRAHT